MITSDETENINIYESEIETLVQDLEDLRIEFESRSEILQYRLDRLRTRESVSSSLKPVPIRSSSKQLSNPFSINDVVRITNNYKGLKGTIGRVIKVTAKQVEIEIDSGATFKKSVTTVEKIDPPESSNSQS